MWACLKITNIWRNDSILFLPKATFSMGFGVPHFETQPYNLWSWIAAILLTLVFTAPSFLDFPSRCTSWRINFTPNYILWIKMQDAKPAWKGSLPTPPVFFSWRFSLGLYVVAPEQSRDFSNNQVLTYPPGWWIITNDFKTWAIVAAGQQIFCGWSDRFCIEILRKPSKSLLGWTRFYD